MTVLSRYIYGELAKVFLTTLVVLTTVISFVGIGQEAIRNGLTLAVAFRVVPYFVLNALCYALPGTTLFTVCTIFARLARKNELTALKSLGISPWSAIRPALLFSLVMSLAGVALIDTAFSWGYHQTQRLLALSIEEIAYSVLRSRGRFESKSVAIRVSGVAGRKLKRPTIVVRGQNRSTTIQAAEAELKSNHGTSSLTVRLRDGWIEIGNQATLRFVGSLEHTIPISSIAADKHKLPHPSHIAMSHIEVERARQELRISSGQSNLACSVAFDLLTGNIQSLMSADWETRVSSLDNQRSRLHRLETEPHRRWSSGFSCLCFALVGIPIAIRLRNADIYSTFGVCFLPILIIYYPLFATGLSMSKSGCWPPYSVWLGNLVCVMVATALFRDTLRR